MHKVNALEIRNTFGAVLELLNKKKGPILVEKNRIPVAVLISMQDFQTRFLDFRAEEERIQLLEDIKKSRVPSSKDSMTLLRELRYGDH